MAERPPPTTKTTRRLGRGNIGSMDVSNKNPSNQTYIHVTTHARRTSTSSHSSYRS